MSDFLFGATTISVGVPCETTITNCQTTTCCRPQGATHVAVNTVPPDLEALRRQLSLLEQAGFESIAYFVKDAAESQRAQDMLSRVRR